MSELSAEQALDALASGEAPVLETLALMNLDTLTRSGLDPRGYFLARIAALVALDAAPVSYAVNLGAAADFGVSAEEAIGVLVAIAPIVGSARIVTAARSLLGALGIAEVVAEDLDE